MDCTICTEKFNRSTRSKTICPFCSFECCRTCLETYVLSLKDEMKCMNCFKYFTRLQQFEMFSRVFLDKKYKLHHSQILFEKEKNFYSEALIAIEEEKRRVERMDKVREINRQIQELQRKKDHLLYGSEQRHSEKKTFSIQCANPTCRGLVDDKWKCCICGKNTCKECFNLQDQEEHKCTEEDIATAKLLRAETRPCPTCGVFIHKISGCDQMFCVSCHSSFSWSTGKIETGILHNPHYFEWLRKHGRINRNPRDVGCGRIIDNTFIYNYPRILLNNLREFIHIRAVELPRFRTDVGNTTLTQRIRFLTGEITEEAFKKQIELKDKEQAKKREIYSILTTFVECGTDIILQGAQNYDNVFKVQVEMKELIRYINERFTVISKALKVVRYEINETTWKFSSK